MENRTAEETDRRGTGRDVEISEMKSVVTLKGTRKPFDIYV